MKKLLLVLICLSALSMLNAVNEVECVCNNHEVKSPGCGICGSQMGKMEKTATGAKCVCFNELPNEEISCADVCKDSGGWSGQFKE